MELKKRYWWFVLYPESAPENWVEIVTERGLPFAVSPLHCYDYEASGELKKPHYHIILAFNGPTTYNCVRELSVDQLCSTIPKPIDNVKGAYDYLTHENHIEKFRYNKDDIKHINGFDIMSYVKLNELDKAKMKVSVIADIQEHNIKEYSQLVDFYLSTGDYEKFNIVSSHTIFFNRYLTSRRNSKMVSDCDIINSMNGGIMDTC